VEKQFYIGACGKKTLRMLIYYRDQTRKSKSGQKKITLINEEISYSKNGFQQQKFLATGIIYKDSLVGSYFFNLVSLEEGQVEDYIFEE
jgi:hypothetical protein